MLKPAVSLTAPRPRKPQRARDKHPQRGPAGLPRPSIVIPRSYYRVSNRFGAAETAVGVATLLVVLAGLPVVARLGWYALYLLFLPVLGASSQKLALLMREAAHGTLFTIQPANRIVGLTCGALLGQNAVEVAREDRDHFRYCGTALDRANPYLSSLARAPRRELVTYLLLPLTGYPFLRAVTARGGLLGDLIRRRPSDAPSDGRHETPFWQRLALFVFVQAGVALIATGFGRYWPLALAYPVSAATLGLFFGRVRTFCEHAAVLRKQGQCTVRSHAPNFVDRVFFYTVNMNFHVERHLYPQIPASNLRLVHRDLAHASYFGEGMVSPSILRTVLRCLNHAQQATARDP